MNLQQEWITSRANPIVRETASLQEKKYRTRLGLFLTEGEKLFREAVQAGLAIQRVLLDGRRADSLLPMVEAVLQGSAAENTPVFCLGGEAFDKISTEMAPQGVICVLKHLDFFKKCTKISMKELPAGERAVFLDSVRDPGNLGAVIRSAAAFGVGTLLLTEDCADLYNPKTVRAAMGCLFKVRVITVADAVGSVSALRESGRRVYAAELREGAVSLRALELRGEDVFVIGNEGHGVAPALSAACDGSVYIPIATGVESLNAAVAASLLLWEGAGHLS